MPRPKGRKTYSRAQLAEGRRRKSVDSVAGSVQENVRNRAARDPRQASGEATAPELYARVAIEAQKGQVPPDVVRMYAEALRPLENSGQILSAADAMVSQQFGADFIKPSEIFAGDAISQLNAADVANEAGIIDTALAERDISSIDDPNARSSRAKNLRSVLQEAQYLVDQENNNNQMLAAGQISPEQHAATAAKVEGRFTDLVANNRIFLSNALNDGFLEGGSLVNRSLAPAPVTQGNNKFVPMTAAERADANRQFGQRLIDESFTPYQYGIYEIEDRAPSDRGVSVGDIGPAPDFSIATEPTTTSRQLGSAYYRAHNGLMQLLNAMNNSSQINYGTNVVDPNPVWLPEGIEASGTGLQDRVFDALNTPLQRGSVPSAILGAELGGEITGGSARRLASDVAQQVSREQIAALDSEVDPAEVLAMANSPDPEVSSIAKAYIARAAQTGAGRELGTLYMPDSFRLGTKQARRPTVLTNPASEKSTVGRLMSVLNRPFEMGGDTEMLGSATPIGSLLTQGSPTPATNFNYLNYFPSAVNRYGVIFDPRQPAGSQLTGQYIDGNPYMSNDFAAQIFANAVAGGGTLHPAMRDLIIREYNRSADAMPPASFGEAGPPLDYSYAAQAFEKQGGQRPMMPNQTLLKNLRLVPEFSEQINRAIDMHNQRKVVYPQNRTRESTLGIQPLGAAGLMDFGAALPRLMQEDDVPKTRMYRPSGNNLLASLIA